MRMHSFLRLFILPGLIILVSALGCGQDADTLPPAPDFSLEDLSGNRITLNQYRGQVVLVDFWATWCPPCRQSIPELVDLQKKYRDKGVVILGISMDDPQQYTNTYLNAFKEKFKINYTVLRYTMKVARDYFSNGNMAIPTLFVVNREGRIADKLVGFAPGAAEGSLKKIL